MEPFVSVIGEGDASCDTRRSKEAEVREELRINTAKEEIMFSKKHLGDQHIFRV